MEKIMRLQKYLSLCGVCSRRKSEELIAAGKVKINGKKAEIGDKINARADVVTIAGKRVAPPQGRRYIMLYKPRGFVTTMKDEQDRRCVVDLVADVGERVYPVGRLDKNSEGLLLMTNDGEFANLMMHPKNHISKLYRVTVRPPVSEDQLNDLAAGVVLDDGDRTLPALVNIVLKDETRVVLNIEIYEGKNRQIRRMCEAVGLTVTRLKRTKIGEMKLGMLPQGKWRDLSEKEVRDLFSAAKRNGQAGDEEHDQNKRGRKRGR